MLVIKVVLSFVIVGICAYIGILKSKKYESREYILREAIILFKGIENEIKYTLAILPNAIESVRVNMKTGLKNVLGNVSYELLQTNLKEENVYNEIASLKELSIYDKQVITNGILELGKTDVEGQIGIINMTLNTLDSLLIDAIEEKKKNSKLFKTVGLATGLMIAIILI